MISASVLVGAAAAPEEKTLAVFIIGALVGVALFAGLVVLLRAFLRVCPPNMVMVLQGAKTRLGDRTYGFKVIQGGRALVIPFLHRAEFLDLSIIPINVRVEGVKAANGITVGADATACVCVDVEDEGLLYMAVERMLGKSRSEIQEQIQQTMIGNFRGAMNRTTPLEAMGMVESVERIESGEEPGSQDEGADTAQDIEKGERARFRRELLNDSNEDLSSFGMRVVSVSFQRIWDTSGYIANLATKSLAHKRQEIEVEEAKLQAQAESAESDASRREEIATNQADEQIVEAKERLGMTDRQSKAQIEQGRQEADGRIAKAQSEGDQAVEQARVELQRLKNTSDVTLQAEHEQKAAETRAKGDDEAVRTMQETRNELLRQKAELLSEADAYGRVPLFVQQQLDKLFEAYEEHARNVGLDNLITMDGNRGLDEVVNRGPEGMVEFLRHFEKAFGIRIRNMVEASGDEGANPTDTASESGQNQEVR